jgi:hypothetical protein
MIVFVEVWVVPAAYTVAVEAKPGDAVNVEVEVEVATAPAVAVTALGTGDGPKVAKNGIGVGWPALELMYETVSTPSGMLVTDAGGQ